MKRGYTSTGHTDFSIGLWRMVDVIFGGGVRLMEVRGVAGVGLVAHPEGEPNLGVRVDHLPAHLLWLKLKEVEE